MLVCKIWRFGLVTRLLPHCLEFLIAFEASDMALAGFGCRFPIVVPSPPLPRFVLSQAPEQSGAVRFFFSPQSTRYPLKAGLEKHLLNQRNF